VAVVPLVYVTVTPEGRFDLAQPVKFALVMEFTAGVPLVVTVKVPVVPTVKVVELALVIAGGPSTVSVKVCVVAGEIPLETLRQNVEIPEVPAAGVPAMVAVVPLVYVKVTPLGGVDGVQPLKAAFVMELTAGVPLVVTVNVPADPAVNVVALALVIAGGPSTVRVNICVAAGDTPLEALRHSVEVPEVPAAGVPPMVAVPLPLSVNVTPEGSVDGLQPLKAAFVIVSTAGMPSVVTVKLPATPVVRVALLALVIDGGPSTCRVNAWRASGETPLEADTQKW
jgi:hypothetical protein